MAVYNRITTYEDFILYCLRKLGAPVINIEVDDSQIEDRVTDALQMFCERHMDSVKEVWWAHVVTAEEAAQGYIRLGDDVVDVLEILRRTDGTSDMGASVENLDDPMVAWAQIFWQQGGIVPSILGYTMTMQQIDMIRTVFTPIPKFVWSYATKKVDPYRALVEGYTVVFRGYKMLDPEIEPGVWNNEWLKKYATCLIKMQWGENISKYKGFPGPAGVELNAERILTEASAEKEKLEAEFQKKYEMPVNFFLA